MGCPEADLPAEEGGLVATGVSCSSKDTGVSCTEAGRPRRADEGGLGERGSRGVSWTEEGRPKMDRRTEDPPPGLSRMLASEAAGWGQEAEEARHAVAVAVRVRTMLRGQVLGCHRTPS